MKFVTPLGLLALLGIAVLILIYLLKPNYQQKFVSSTFVWNLSLKYKKKSIPISKLRNLLIILCQILIIATGAFILGQPFISASDTQKAEKIVIIDASASMLAIQANGKTRFENAVLEVKKFGQEVMEQQELITVILAGKEADYVKTSDYNIFRTDSDLLEKYNAALDGLIAPNNTACTYGQADIDGAMTLAEEVILENPNIEIILYTATEYVDTGKVVIKNISDSEWNAAILECNPIKKDNYYIFEVEVASYNKNMDLTVNLQVDGVNLEEKSLNAQEIARCLDNNTVVITFDEGIYAYQNVQVYIQADDSFIYDNSFYLYGGTKETINVLYVSPLRNNFFSGILMGLHDMLRQRWNIVIKEVSLEDNPDLSGYDFYIFEHEMPRTLPNDGIVLLVNLNNIPQNLGLGFGGRVTNRDREEDDFVLANGMSHPIMANVNAANIIVSQYMPVLSYNGFQPLMYCGTDPVFLVKNEPNEKIAVLSFSLNRSNLPVIVEFPVLMYNLFDYFLPPTITKYVYDVNESVNLNARGPSLSINGPGLDETFNIFPHKISASVWGTYTLTQMPISGIEISEDIYVRITRAESEFVRTESLYPPFIPEPPSIDWDLVLYFAAALVAFWFFERLLHLKGDQ